MPELPEVETVMRGLRAAAGGPRHRARHRASPRPALAAAGGPAAPPDRRARHRLPPARQVHPDAAGRRRFGAAASRHVGPDGADARRGPTSRRRTSTWCWRPTTAGGSGFVDPRRFGSVDLVPTPQEDTHRLLAELGPEPLDRRLHPCPPVGRAGRQADADQGGAAGPEGRGRPRQHLCLRGAVPRPAQPAALGAHHPRHARRAPGAGDQGRRCRRRSPPAAPSLRDYVQPDGELGYFQHAWKVYGREGEACERCPGRPACPGIRRITQSARSTFYCPRYPAVATSRPPPAGRAKMAELPEHHRRDAWPGRADPAQPPDGAERAVRRADGRTRRPSSWPSTTTRDRRHRADRQRESLRRRRRHQGDEGPHPPAAPAGGLHRQALGDGAAGARSR